MHSIALLSEDKSSKSRFENLLEMKIETPAPRAPSGLEEWKPMYEGKRLLMRGELLFQVSDKQITSNFDLRISRYQQNTLPFSHIDLIFKCIILKSHCFKFLN